MGIQFISGFFILFLSTGGCVLSLLGDSSKSELSVSSRYVRSDEIGPKFQKAYQPLKLNYQWKGNGIILKSGKGKMAKEEFELLVPKQAPLEEEIKLLLIPKDPENNKLKQDEMIPTIRKLNTIFTKKLSFIRSIFIKKFVKFNIYSNYTLVS